jgi:hypothetical protein
MGICRGGCEGSLQIGGVIRVHRTSSDKESLIHMPKRILIAEGETSVLGSDARTQLQVST